MSFPKKQAEQSVALSVMTGCFGIKTIMHTRLVDTTGLAGDQLIAYLDLGMLEWVHTASLYG